MKSSSLILAALALATGSRAADLPTLWAERVKCTVAVEYVTQTELERRPSVAYGTVVDGAGTIILPSAAIDLRVSPGTPRDPRPSTWGVTPTPAGTSSARAPRCSQGLSR